MAATYCGKALELADCLDLQDCDNGDSIVAVEVPTTILSQGDLGSVDLPRTGIASKLSHIDRDTIAQPSGVRAYQFGPLACAGNSALAAAS